MTHLLRSAFIAAALVGGITEAAQADLLAAASRVTPANGTNTTFAPVPIAEGGVTTLTFKTTKVNEMVLITYNAECSSINGSGWLSVRIVVDGLNAQPNAGTNFAFCHAGVEAGAVRQGVIRLPTPGNHTVRIDAAAAGGSTSWTLDDSLLTVQN